MEFPLLIKFRHCSKLILMITEIPSFDKLRLDNLSLLRLRVSDGNSLKILQHFMLF